MNHVSEGRRKKKVSAVIISRLYQVSLFTYRVLFYFRRREAEFAAEMLQVVSNVPSSNHILQAEANPETVCENHQCNELPFEERVFEEDEIIFDAERDSSEFNSQTTELLICSLLIEYQIQSNTTDASMQKLLKLINECSHLMGCGKNIVPKSYYELSKNIETEPTAMNFICSNCNTLTNNIVREASRKYPEIRCSKCTQIIVPKDAIKSPNGYFVKLNVSEKIKKILEHPVLGKKIHFCDPEKNIGNELGRFSQGRIYKRVMKKNEISMTIFTDGVKIFRSAKKDFWPIFLMINELEPPFRARFIMLIAVFYGTSKPQGKLIMDCVAADLNSLSSSGVDWFKNGEPTNTKVKMFVNTLLIIA